MCEQVGPCFNGSTDGEQGGNRPRWFYRIFTGGCRLPHTDSAFSPDCCQTLVSSPGLFLSVCVLVLQKPGVQTGCTGASEQVGTLRKKSNFCLSII